MPASPRSYCTVAMGLFFALARNRPLLAENTANPCGAPAAELRLLESLHAGHFLDVHAMALTLSLLCPQSPDGLRWRLIDALSLFQLDETTRAQRLLYAIEHDHPQSPTAIQARTILTLGFWRAGDTDAFEDSIVRVDPAARARLLALQALSNPIQFARRISALPSADVVAMVPLGERYRDAAHTRRPWLGGVLSALLPGAGQVYAGSWQGAAVTFALNAVFIGATVELGRRRLWGTAAAAGMAASFFYVGGITNAADLARRRNETTAAPIGEDIERRLVPEAYP